MDKVMEIIFHGVFDRTPPARKKNTNSLISGEIIKWFAMRILGILITISCLSASAHSDAQGVTYSATNKSLDVVFDALGKQTGYDFFYRLEDLRDCNPITIAAKNIPLEKVIDMILLNQPLQYRILKKTVFIQRKSSAATSLSQDTLINVYGRVVDSAGTALKSATIKVKNKPITLLTDSEGAFSIKDISPNDVLQISYVGYQAIELPANKINTLSTINLSINSKSLNEITVRAGNTGYQVIDKNHPGSFDVVNNELINRRVSSDIISRIQDLTPGVSFNTPNDGLVIRGRNSIFSNVNPLIVIDNFPYDGDINNINPNDVESVTILKDAASAAQWGARAGNGVIVITTKRGKTARPSIQVNTNVSILEKPDLWSLPIISSSDAIEVERWLFDKGYYNSAINNRNTKPPLTPVQEILLRKRNGEISEQEANALIEPLKAIDYRTDVDKYFYRNSVTSRTAINISGNTSTINYYLSAGWDKGQQSLVGNSNNRVTLRSQNTFKATKQLSIGLGFNYTFNDINNGGNPGQRINSGAGKGLYPYADLVDNNGNGLTLVKNFRAKYADTAGRGKIQDWHYRPYDEINSIDSKYKTRDLIVNTSIKYKFSNSLNAELYYQFQNSIVTNQDLNNIESFYTRDYINTFYQPNASTNSLMFPVPIGGIMDISHSEILSHQGRIQLNYIESFGSDHNVNIIGGAEIKDLVNKGYGHRIYGYEKKGNLVNPSMDFVTRFPTYPRLYTTSQVRSSIYNPLTAYEKVDRFVSYYVNGSYSFKDRYTITASARHDAANLFGVTTNQKGVPLWSSGVGWNISNEDFYLVSILPYLKLRATYGHTGNFSRLATAVTTAAFYINELGAKYANIENPPNDKLRWEQNRIFNIGLDYAFKNDRVSGSIEFFWKHLKDLLGTGLVDPTSGLSQGSGTPVFFGNLASMRGKGFEISLTTRNIDRQFKWQTDIILSYAQNKVSEYLMPAPTLATSFVGADFNVTPLVGKPIFSVFRFPWAGLDPENGDPRGFLGKQTSKDYSQIVNETKIDSLDFFGAAQPPYFGSIRNTFSYKNFSISCNISYKFGYYFMRNSVSYITLFNTWTGHSDYAKRWQKPGDEVQTNVPSMVYTNTPNFGSRDFFYANSSALIYKGDHIRLDDISINYTINRNNKRGFPFAQMQIYAYINNLQCMLWRANSEGIDPQVNGSLKPGRSYSLGANFSF